MTLLVPIKTSDLGDGENRYADPRILLKGNPLMTSWRQDEIKDKVRTGVWRSEPGKNISRKENRYEFCLILDGKVLISEDGGQTHSFAAGDAFVMKPGFTGTWETIETVTKLFVIIE